MQQQQQHLTPQLLAHDAQQQQQVEHHQHYYSHPPPPQQQQQQQVEHQHFYSQPPPQQQHQPQQQQLSPQSWWRRQNRQLFDMWRSPGTFPGPVFNLLLLAADGSAVHASAAHLAALSARFVDSWMGGSRPQPVPVPWADQMTLRAVVGAAHGGEIGALLPQFVMPSPPVGAAVAGAGGGAAAGGSAEGVSPVAVADANARAALNALRVAHGLGFTLVAADAAALLRQRVTPTTALYTLVATQGLGVGDDTARNGAAATTGAGKGSGGKSGSKRRAGGGNAAAVKPEQHKEEEEQQQQQQQQPGDSVTAMQATADAAFAAEMAALRAAAAAAAGADLDAAVAAAKATSITLPVMATETVAAAAPETAAATKTAATVTVLEALSADLQLAVCAAAPPHARTGTRLLDFVAACRAHGAPRLGLAAVARGLVDLDASTPSELLAVVNHRLAFESRALVRSAAALLHDAALAGVPGLQYERGPGLRYVAACNGVGAASAVAGAEGEGMRQVVAWRVSDWVRVSYASPRFPVEGVPGWRLLCCPRGLRGGGGGGGGGEAGGGGAAATTATTTTGAAAAPAAAGGAEATASGAPGTASANGNGNAAAAATAAGAGAVKKQEAEEEHEEQHLALFLMSPPPQEAAQLQAAAMQPGGGPLPVQQQQQQLLASRPLRLRFQLFAANQLDPKRSRAGRVIEHTFFAGGGGQDFVVGGGSEVIGERCLIALPELLSPASGFLSPGFEALVGINACALPLPPPQPQQQWQQQQQPAVQQQQQQQQGVRGVASAPASPPHGGSGSTVGLPAYY